MSGWMGAIEDGLAGAAKGAAAGSIVPGFGSAAGGLIGLATALVPHVFGADAKPALRAAAEVVTGQAAEADQVAAIAGDPALAEQFRVQALQIAADRERAWQDSLMADRADARATTVDLAGKGSAIAWGAPVVSVVVMLSFGVLAGVVLFHQVPEGSQALANVLLGALAGMATTVVSFWMGSSAGSAAKSEMLANSVPASLLPHPATIVPSADVLK